MYYNLFRTYKDPDGPKKEKDPIEERPKSSALFFDSCSPILSVSIPTNQMTRSGLIASKNDSLSGQEPENETDNFRFCSQGCAMLNWMMKCDVQ